MTSNSKTEKIYLTYKTRMLSEALARSHARFYTALIPWYSFLVIALSISQGFGYYSGSGASLFIAVSSVGIFGLSLYINGHELWQRAEGYKDCYLKLTRIYESNASDDEKMNEYNSVLKIYENQTDSDYDEMLFDAYLRGQKLMNSRGTIILTYSVCAKVVFSKIFRYFIRVLLFLAPILLGFHVLKDSDNAGKVTEQFEQRSGSESISMSG
jgi:hypothetical protein